MPSKEDYNELRYQVGATFEISGAINTVDIPQAYKEGRGYTKDEIELLGYAHQINFHVAALRKVEKQISAFSDRTEPE